MPSGPEALKAELTSKLEPLLLAIPGPSVSGADPNLDTDFEIVKKEIDRLTSVEGTPPNWRLVIKVSEDLLRNRSKDLRIAGWWASAQLNVDGFRGFALGLLMLRLLVERYWDTMFPELKRVRGRANLYAWFTEHAYAKLDPVEPKPADADAVRLGEALLYELDDALSEKLGEMHPGPGRLRGLFRAKTAALPAPAPEPVASPAAPAPAPSTPEVSAAATPSVAPARAPAPSVPVAAQPPQPTAVSRPAAQSTPAVSVEVDVPLGNLDLESVNVALATCGDGFKRVAEVLRQNDRTSAFAYRLVRLAQWGTLDELPYAEGGRMAIRSPDRSYVDGLTGLAQTSQWDELLQLAEEAVGRYELWIDCHRYLALAMDQLGGFPAAREEVGRAVVDITRRLPGLLELSFSDGMPIADADTRRWIDSERERWGGSGGAVQKDPLDDGFARANTLLQEGKLGEALTAAKEAAVRSGSHRDRFRGLLRTARIATNSGELAFARAMLEGLLKDVDAHRLEEWDPALCATLYADLLVAMRGETAADESLGANVDRAGREAVLFEKLCRIDPRAALELARR